ncbi:preprotein translocase subunit SecE [Paracoccus contaminans]|uniref:Protein translocase subunit SecE n=1 Tax=Paracoccus contaminans TaxID=1945662 RepID=A0A1W6CUQ7_9RHOB|nr:preprotein translocase subunit SecE [Paracoccus contaminans]ARJ68592.1 preprotein translocase subunit SecE [Paracoccus contaminans]
MASPVQFLSQVRSEAAKIVWPTRREVTTTTIMVFVMATVFSLFFFTVDLLIRGGLSAVLRAIGS